MAPSKKKKYSRYSVAYVLLVSDPIVPELVEGLMVVPVVESVRSA